MTRKGQVPSRTPVPGTVPKTKSKEAEGPQTSDQGPLGTGVLGSGTRWGQGSPAERSAGGGGE